MKSIIGCRLLLSHKQACTTQRLSSVERKLDKERVLSGQGGGRRKEEGRERLVQPFQRVAPCSPPPPHYLIAFLLTQRENINDMLRLCRTLTASGLLELRPFSKDLTNQK